MRCVTFSDDAGKLACLDFAVPSHAGFYIMAATGGPDGPAWMSGMESGRGFLHGRGGRAGRGETAGPRRGALARPLFAIATLMAAGAFCAPRAANAACATAGAEAVDLASVESRLELRLRDGRLLRLAGLDPALSTPDTPDRDDQARAMLAGWLAGPRLTVTVLTNVPDRWGRLPALAFVEDGKPGGLAAAAIGAGLGRYFADPAATACRTDLIEAEARARAQKLGLWADPYYAVLAAGDFAGFAERAGTLAVAEGRVERVETGSYRSKIIFAGDTAGFQGNGSRASQFLSATITPRITKLFEARGMRLTSLSGKRIRVRGLLDVRFGPEIELASPDSLEMIEPSPAQIAPGVAK